MKSQSLYIHANARNGLSSQNNKIVSVPQPNREGWSIDHMTTATGSLTSIQTFKIKILHELDDYYPNYSQPTHVSLTDLA